jgi:hypothetical protein
VKDHFEVIKALYSGKTLRHKSDHKIKYFIRDGSIYCVDRDIVLYGQINALFDSCEHYEICPDGETVIETEVSVSRNSLFTAEVFKKLSADKKSVWKCTLEKVK